MGGLSGDNKGGFSDIARSIRDAVMGTGSVAFGSGNPEARRDQRARNNSSGGPAAATPGSDSGMGSDNADRLPSGAGPGGTRVKNTFAGANPLTTSGFPVGHPKYKAPAGAPTTVAKKPTPAPKKKTLLTEGGLSRPTLAGVPTSLLGS